MVQLWTHEVLRVFHDRLTDDADRVWIGRLLSEMLETHFQQKAAKVFGIERPDDDSLIVGMRGLLFGDFMVPGADPQLYKCVRLTLWPVQRLGLSLLRSRCVHRHR